MPLKGGSCNPFNPFHCVMVFHTNTGRNPSKHGEWPRKISCNLKYFYATGLQALETSPPLLLKVSYCFCSGLMRSWTSDL